MKQEWGPTDQDNSSDQQKTSHNFWKIDAVLEKDGRQDNGGHGGGEDYAERVWDRHEGHGGEAEQAADRGGQALEQDHQPHSDVPWQK